MCIVDTLSITLKKKILASKLQSVLNEKILYLIIEIPISRLYQLE